jgi:hypothetical protein
MRQLYKQAKFIPAHIAIIYRVGESNINHVLRYDQPERARLNHTSRPKLLNNAQID